MGQLTGQAGRNPGPWKGDLGLQLWSISRATTDRAVDIVVNGCQSCKVRVKERRRNQGQCWAKNELMETTTIEESSSRPMNLRLTELLNFMSSLISRQWNILHLPAIFPKAQKKTP